MAKLQWKIATTNLIFLVIGLTPICANAQSIKYDDLVLKIDVANFFKNKKIVRGLLENNSKLKICYNLGIELKYENKWVEIVENLDNPNDKSTKIAFIDPDQTKRFSFKPSTIEDPSHHFRHLRFFIKFGNDYQNLKYKFSFKEFPLFG